jgi:hypothetical protein
MSPVCFDTSPRRISTLSRDNVVTKPRLNSQSKKFMFTIVWSPSGFYVIDRFPNDAKVNSTYLVTNLFVSLEQTIFLRGRATHEKRLAIHVDNCSVHRSRVSTNSLEEHNILRMPHLPYLLDLALSCFYLFPTVKEKLERIHLADDD